MKYLYQNVTFIMICNISSVYFQCQTAALDELFGNPQEVRKF